MYVGVHKDVALFCTKYNDRYNLIQKFRGIDNDTLTYNSPIDFMESGLMDNTKEDVWHVDLPFNYSNDEATPFLINGKHIGANHGQPSAVMVVSKNHGKTFADIGSLWQDQAGVKFTLLRINNESVLTFLSQNVGESEERYSFVTTISGKLTYIENGINTSEIVVKKQSRAQLYRANRYLEKRIYVCENGNWSPMFFSGEYDLAEIREEYHLINPATICEDIRKSRPKDGYSSNVNLADYGKPMVNLKLKYRIMPSGEILCFFEANKLMNVQINHYYGVMFQEKLDVYGGGGYRILPKTKPFTCEEGDFDFNKPVALRGESYPSSVKFTPEYFENPNSPPDRVIDVFKDKDGNSKLGFACGFLPEFDCAPSVRKNNIEHAFNVVKTRKAYPCAVGVDVAKFRGIGYKKFFPMSDDNPAYTIDYDGKTYIYTHFIKQGKITLPIDGRVKLYEKSGNVEWFQDCTSLTISGSQGYAVFITE